jgi:hypothetical protein
MSFLSRNTEQIRKHALFPDIFFTLSYLRWRLHTDLDKFILLWRQQQVKYCWGMFKKRRKTKNKLKIVFLAVLETLYSISDLCKSDA